MKTNSSCFVSDLQKKFNLSQKNDFILKIKLDILYRFIQFIDTSRAQTIQTTTKLENVQTSYKLQKQVIIIFTKKISKIVDITNFHNL